MNHDNVSMATMNTGKLLDLFTPEAGKVQYHGLSPRFAHYYCTLCRSGDQILS